jgi:hypothetical protein
LALGCILRLSLGIDPELDVVLIAKEVEVAELAVSLDPEIEERAARRTFGGVDPKALQCPLHPVDLGGQL